MDGGRAHPCPEGNGAYPRHALGENDQTIWENSAPKAVLRGRDHGAHSRRDRSPRPPRRGRSLRERPPPSPSEPRSGESPEPFPPVSSDPSGGGNNAFIDRRSRPRSSRSSSFTFTRSP